MHLIHSISNITRSSGGTSAYVADLANEQVKATSAAVGILTERSLGESMMISPDVSLFEVSDARGFDLCLSQQIALKRLNLIHSHGLWLHCNHVTVRFCRKNQIPLVLSPHGMLEDEALQFSKWKKRLGLIAYQRKDLNSVDAFHATAPAEAESIRRFGLRQPIIVSPPGVELPSLRPEAEGRGAEGSNKRMALFLGRVHPIKNLLSLVVAWAKVRPKGWNLVIAGADEVGYAEELRKAVREQKMEQVVVLVAGAAYGADKERLYRKASLFILPSFSENFGIVVPEALSYGVPVIASTGAPWGELPERNCGWWVDPTSASLAEALEDATQLSDAKLSQMGMNGRALVEEKYQWDSIAEKMVADYQWILGQGPKPTNVLET